MSVFRKIIVFSLIIFTTVLITSCTADTVDSRISNYTIDDEAADTNEFYTGESTSDAWDNAHIPFTDDPEQIYEFLWTDRRDRYWEEDIIFFARTALSDHPLFSKSLEHMLNRGDVPQQMLFTLALIRNDIQVTHNNSQDAEALRNYFFDRVNSLIIAIPTLSDNEIIFGLAEIAAILADMHTAVVLPDSDRFLFRFVSLSDGFYCILAPKEFEHVLYSKLVNINGLDVDEVLSRFSRVVAHENEYWLRSVIASVHIMNGELLRYLGIVDDSNTAEFTFANAESEKFNIGIESVLVNANDLSNLLGSRSAFFNLDGIELIQHSFSDSLLMYSRPGDMFWFEYFPEESIMYLRISNFEIEAPQGSFAEAHAYYQRYPFNQEILSLTANARKIDKIIIDLRGNSGGTRWDNLNPILFNNERINSVYLLLDSSSASASIMAASWFINNMENVYVVGEPAGQPESFFGGWRPQLLPNSGIEFSVSDGLFSLSNNKDTSLIPDIFIPLTIQDIINNHDPVLEFVWVQ